MPHIQVLQPHTANQIAAGEVVERPASVVKELVENAIDAQATAISVEIQDGGVRSIVVVDNGCGIPAEDCHAAFLRHATSKIRSIEDLNSLQTMGFRGEALASVASVSSIVMTTRTADEATGVRVAVERGDIASQENIACACGTTICVNELFASVPARLKFLKSSRAEAGYIGDFIARMILSHPEISFRYLSNDKVVYETYGENDLFSAIFCVYGASVADHLIPIAYDNAYLKLSGYIGQQELNRPNRTFQSLFVNGRYIRSFPISGSVMRAYDTRLMGGRFPFFVLNLTIAPQEMDVNVHPSKMEVRFSDEQRVTGAIYAACRDALLRFDAVEPPQTPSADIVASVTLGVEPSQPDTLADTSTRMFVSPRPTSYDLNESTAFSSYPAHHTGANTAIPTIRLSESREKPAYRMPDPIRILARSDLYVVVGCLFHTYWIVASDDDVYLIDQHAAHERRLYERFCNKEIVLSGQRLLLPASVTLTPTEMETMTQYRSELESLGFLWENAGTLCVEVIAYPILNGVTLRDSYLHEVLSLLHDKTSDIPFAICKERIIQSACKHAIKAGEDMSEEEITALMQEYADSASPLTCPHGRPIVLRYHRRDLEKLFKRIV